MRRRRAVILGAVGAIGAVAFMLGVGAYRTRNRPARNELLPLPIGEMSWALTDHCRFFFTISLRGFHVIS